MNESGRAKGRATARTHERGDERERERTHAAALMQRVRDDDERAFAELVQVYAPTLTRIAYALLDDWDMALDVSQDTFVAVWDRRAAIEDLSNIPGYLTRAVRNRALNVRTHELRQQKMVDSVARLDLDRPTIARNDAEQALESADTTRQLWRVIKTLPASPRRVLLLNWYARMTYAEIAEALGIKTATVRQLMFRAASRLTEYYRDFRSDPR